jgi:iron complex outermembrane receptor protein
MKIFVSRRFVTMRFELFAHRIGHRRRWKRARRFLAMVVTYTVVGLGLPGYPAFAQSQEPLPSAGTLKDLTLEELMDIEVTLVSRRPQRLSETASAIQVITGEDIKRSGAMNLADALRLASNLEVQQINSYAWVVSARGFDALFANKLLVMIDGRTVYTPLFAGVFWDAQNVLLEDIDRIEIVSGPGGTLWGANAVNGVINIITKTTRDTQGFYASVAGGSFLQDFGAARYGGRIGTNLTYRIYGQRFDRNSTLLPNGSDGMNAWNMTQGGFRIDYDSSEANALTLQGDSYSGAEYNAPVANSTLDGQYVLGRWTHAFSEASEMRLQLYFDRTWRRDIPSRVSDELHTYDFDFQHRFFHQRHSIVWGLGYRLLRDEAQTSTPFVGFLPPRRNMQLFSTYVQDEITLVRDRLRFTVGTKLEHNDFSGFELQPSGRLAWTPGRKQTIWGAVSRAVRSPSRIDSDYHIPKTPPFAIAGGPGFDSEKLLAYELGYRVQPRRKLSLSLATFYNRYDELYSVEPARSLTPLPYTIQNGAEGQSSGAELSGTYQLVDGWRLRGGYTYFHKNLRSKPGHNVTDAVLASLGNDPSHQFSLQSIVDLPAKFQFDVTANYVDTLPNPRVPRYLTSDARLAWRFRNLEFSVVGQNLLDKRHSEYSTAQEIPRSIYGRVSWRHPTP